MTVPQGARAPVSDLRRLTAQSRERLAAVAVLREQGRLIARTSRRRLDGSRRLLDRSQLARPLHDAPPDAQV